jgi:hypothetical protein
MAFGEIVSEVLDVGGKGHHHPEGGLGRNGSSSIELDILLGILQNASSACLESQKLSGFDKIKHPLRILQKSFDGTFEQAPTNRSDRKNLLWQACPISFSAKDCVRLKKANELMACGRVTSRFFAFLSLPSSLSCRKQSDIVFPARFSSLPHLLPSHRLTSFLPSTLSEHQRKITAKRTSPTLERQSGKTPERRKNKRKGDRGRDERIRRVAFASCSSLSLSSPFLSLCLSQPNQREIMIARYIRSSSSPLSLHPIGRLCLKSPLPTDPLDRPLDARQTLERPTRDVACSFQRRPVLWVAPLTIGVESAVQESVLVREDRSPPFGADEGGVEEDVDLLAVEPRLSGELKEWGRRSAREE